MLLFSHRQHLGHAAHSRISLSLDAAFFADAESTIQHFVACVSTIDAVDKVALSPPPLGGRCPSTPSSPPFLQFSALVLFSRYALRSSLCLSHSPAICRCTPLSASTPLAPLISSSCSRRCWHPSALATLSLTQSPPTLPATKRLSLCARASLSLFCCVCCACVCDVGGLAGLLDMTGCCFVRVRHVLTRMNETWSRHRSLPSSALSLFLFYQPPPLPPTLRATRNHTFCCCGVRALACVSLAVFWSGGRGMR